MFVKKRTLKLDLRSKPACRCWHLLAGAGQALLQVLPSYYLAAMYVASYYLYV